MSFGSANEAVELGPLNVLIGKNSCGKSNLVESFSLLRALPKDFLAPVREGGGVREWLWKGSKETPVAEINVSLNYPGAAGSLTYRLNFTEVNQRLELVDEAIETSDADFYYRYRKGSPVLNVSGKSGRTERFLKKEDLATNQSVLSQRKDPDQYPELAYIGDQFSKIGLYREWNLGRHAPSRLPQHPDLPGDYLLEDTGNIGLVLNDLQNRTDVRKLIAEKLKEFYDEFDDITTRVHGGTIQIYLHEKNLNRPIPAMCLSDGTLRFLSLLLVLCHPEPPPLICIEEPELGLHPDILPQVAKLLIEASERTQIVVTTHSDIIVDELTGRTESVIVCEKSGGSTIMDRLDVNIE